MKKGSKKAYTNLFFIFPVLDCNFRHAKLETTNHGYKVLLSECNKEHTVTVLGKTYKLAQFHFHTPSEHVIDGVRYQAEAHLVHLSDDGKALVVGLDVLLSKFSNRFMKSLLPQFPETQADEEVEGSYNIYRDFVRYRQGYWHYSGSLTTPPCSPIVQWYLMKEPIVMSFEQLGLMTESLLTLPETQVAITIIGYMYIYHVCRHVLNVYICKEGLLSFPSFLFLGTSNKCMSFYT